jgi:hypothetical protein
MVYMQKRPKDFLRTAVLVAQTILVVTYAVFFSIVPAVLDNPDDHRRNMAFFLPTIAVIVSVLGCFFARLSAILMTTYTITIYTVLVILDRGHWASFAYAFGPAWPPLVAAVALFWAAKRQSTVSSERSDIAT